MTSQAREKRQQERRKAVLPVRVRGKDAAGSAFDEVALTLDVAPAGARLGSIRRALQLLDEVTVIYRQHRMNFRVVWVKKMANSSEYQIGLQALAGERDAWGLTPGDSKAVQPVNRTAAVTAATGA